MNVINEFCQLFNSNTISISERVMVLNLKFEQDGNQLPLKDKIFQILSKFPKRDKVELVLKNNYDDFVLINNQNDTIKGIDLDQFYEESDGDEISIELNIDKTIKNNILSVYQYEEFSKHIIDKPLLEVMRIFHGLLLDREYIIFELFDSNVIFSTNTMIFKSSQLDNLTMTFPRNNKLEICNQISSFFNILDFKLIPEDFKIISSTENNVFEEIFNKIKTLMSLIYISNTSVINNEELNLEIVGQRKLEFNYNINSDMIDNTELYRIYEWVSTDGNSIDKAIIARNIISLHCQFTDLINTDAKTFSSIQSNFKLYQKDNVDKYIELKNKVAEYILEIVNSTGDIVINLLDKLKQNMIACFTFLLSVVLANIVSNQPLDNIFTKEITAISEIVLFVSVIFLIISVLEMNYRLNKLVSGYNELKRSYNGILDERDIINIFEEDNEDGNILDKNIKDAKSKRNIFTIIWIGILILSLVLVETISDYPIVAYFIKNLIR